MPKGKIAAQRDRHRRPVPQVVSRDEPMRRFWEHLPKERFHNALELAKDPKFEKLWALLLDPGKRNASFMALCRMAEITLNDLYDFWRQHTLHAGLIEMMSAFPEVAVDISIDARSRMGACTRCDGLGTVVDVAPGGEVGRPRMCPVCKGTKEVRIIGDKSARDHMFEAIGLAGKPSPSVAIQQNNFGLDAELGDVLQMSQKVISSGRGGGESG